MKSHFDDNQLWFMMMLMMMLMPKLCDEYQERVPLWIGRHKGHCFDMKPAPLQCLVILWPWWKRWWQWKKMAMSFPKNTGSHSNVCDSNSHTLSWPPTIYKGLTRLRKIHSDNDNLKHVNMRDDYALLFSLFSSHPLYANISRPWLVGYHPTGFSYNVGALINS